MAMDRSTARQASTESVEDAEPAEHSTLRLVKCEALGSARGILRGAFAGAIVWAVTLAIIVVLA